MIFDFFKDKKYYKKLFVAIDSKDCEMVEKLLRYRTAMYLDRFGKSKFNNINDYDDIPMLAALRIISDELIVKMVNQDVFINDISYAHRIAEYVQDMYNHGGKK